MAIYTYLLSCLFAFIAGHMVNYSIIFLSLEWFNSHALAGLGYGLCFGPPLILGWFAGVYCDRYSPRRVILIAQNSFFVSLGLLYMALSASPELQKIWLLLAALCSGIGWSFVAPARFSGLPFHIGKWSLAAASIALNLMVMSGFGIAPMLLKLIEAHYSWQAVFITAACLFALSSSLLWPLRYKFTPKPAAKALHEIAESLRYVQQSHHIKQLLLLSSISYLLMGPIQVILPSIAENTLNLSASAQGYYLSMVAFSLIAGGILAMRLKAQGRVGTYLMLAIFGAAIGIAGLASADHLLASVVILFFASACGGIAISFIVAGLQAFSPDAHRGRIMSFYTIIGQFIPAASGISAGVLAQTYSPSTALYITAGIIITSSLVCFWIPNNIRHLKSFENA